MVASWLTFKIIMYIRQMLHYAVFMFIVLCVMTNSHNEIIRHSIKKSLQFNERCFFFFKSSHSEFKPTSVYKQHNHTTTIHY